MQLTLNNIELLTATEPLRCDAVEMYFDAKKVRKIELMNLKFLDVVKIFENRLGKIKGEYVRYEFIDMETGELLEMNCGKDMDYVCKYYRLYPEYLLKLIL